MSTFPARIRIRQDSAADWTTENPTPPLGELCLETDTGLIKSGDGATAWASLDYITDWGLVQSKPTTLAGYGITDAAALTHTHATSEVTGLDAALAGKAASTHTHAAGDITSGALGIARVPIQVAAIARAYVVRMIPSRGANTRLVLGSATSTPSGTIGTSTNENEGVFQPFTTAATTNALAINSIGLAQSGTGCGRPRSARPMLLGSFRTGSSLASIRLLIGAASNTIGADDNASVHSAAFRYSTSASDAGWRCCTSNGTTQTTSAAVGPSVTVSTVYFYAIDMRDPSKVDFYIGTTEEGLSLVHSATGTLPGVNTYFAPTTTVTTLENVAKTLSLGAHVWSAQA